MTHLKFLKLLIDSAVNEWGFIAHILQMVKGIA